MDLDLSSRGALSIPAFRLWSGIGRTKIYEEIAAGRLLAVSAGGRTLIPVTAAQAWLASLPTGTARNPNLV